MTRPRRIGLEVELLAPPGKSRRDLAEAIAEQCDGTVKRIFHPQSEPSKVPGQPFFHNLTLGFEVYDADGRWVASCVDDLTLQVDLDKRTPPVSGWYRVLSDDSRLLNLIARQSDPAQPLETVLEPIAELFGTRAQAGPGGMLRVVDEEGKAVSIVAPLPGERERPCELITAPLDSEHEKYLERYLGLARELGFTAPGEGATHIHFDGRSLQSAAVLSNLIQLFSHYGADLKKHVGFNPRCRRLGDWPAELLPMVTEPGFRELEWQQVCDRLESVKLTKYCDFNLVNLLLNRPEKTTFEVRVMPVWLQTEPIMSAVGLFGKVLELAERDDISSWLTGNGVEALLAHGSQN